MIKTVMQSDEWKCANDLLVHGSNKKRWKLKFCSGCVLHTLN